MKSWIRPVVPAVLVAATLGMALAKLPPTPPLDPAKAEEKKAKDNAAAAVTAAQQAKAEDRAVAHYLQQQKAKGKAVTPQMPPNAAEMDAKAREAQAKVAAATAGAAGNPAPATPSSAGPVAAGPMPGAHASAQAAGAVKVTPAKGDSAKK